MSIDRILELENEVASLKSIIIRLTDYTFPELDSLDLSQFQFIKDEFVRRQVELDYLKMLRTPVSDFKSFCKFSFYQVENLLNYYYSLRFSSEVEIKRYFTVANGDQNKTKSKISEIPAALKWSKFAQEFLQDRDKKIDGVNLRSLNYDIQKIAYVRNSSSHRNSYEIEDYEEDVYRDYLRIKSKSERSAEEQKIFWLGNKIEFKRRESFSIVRNRTEAFVKLINRKIEELPST